MVKADGPEDLVFQSVKAGRPMRDNNILIRFIKPAARKLGIGFVNWRSLRTSYATWMVEAGANPKDVQGQMRHSRIATMDIYAQFVPESQRRAVDKVSYCSSVRRYGTRPSLIDAVTFACPPARVLSCTLTITGALQESACVE